MSVKIVDFHTHAFPDALAERAMSLLEQGAPGRSHLDGKLSSLLRSMDDAGIERAVVCNIATKPEQFGSILTWCKSVASDRIIPFPSVHPADPQAADRIRRVAAEGLKGIKLHPYYQELDLDDERVFPLCEALVETGLLFVCHTGFDFAFPHIRKCDPPRVLRLLERFPGLKLVTSHLGGWKDWELVRRHLIGKPIYMEISYSIELIGHDAAREMLLAHPPDYLLFGTDSPWTSQEDALASLRALHLGPELEARILSTNAHRLLGLEDAY